MAKIALWTLENEADELKWFGKVAGGEGDTYTVLKSI